MLHRAVCTTQEHTVLCSEVPRTWSLMLCSGPLGILNHFIIEFVLCKCSPMAQQKTMVLGPWSLSSPRSCFLPPCYFPGMDSWPMVALPPPCDHCHLLPSAWVRVQEELWLRAQALPILVGGSAVATSALGLQCPGLFEAPRGGDRLRVRLTS